jgi:hypothetical protein
MPTPSMPTPSMPTQSEMPTPSIPTPSMPTPSMPTPSMPTQSEMATPSMPPKPEMATPSMQQPSSLPLPKNSGLQGQIKKDSKDDIATKYMETLVEELTNKRILDETDVKNLKLKIKNNLLTLVEAVESLEKLKKEASPQNIYKRRNDSMFNELPSDFMSPIGEGISNWDNEYTILNTNKWQVPVQRPPPCIVTTSMCSMSN